MTDNTLDLNKYPKIKTFLARCGGLVSLNVDAQKAMWELHEVVRKEITGSKKLNNLTYVPISELSSFELVRYVLSDKNTPYYIRKQVASFMVRELRFPVKSDMSLDEKASLSRKRVINTQKRLVKFVQQNYAGFPPVLKNEDPAPKEAKAPKSAKELFDSFVKKLSNRAGDKEKKQDGDEEWTAILCFVKDNQETIKGLMDKKLEAVPFEGAKVLETKE